MNALVSFDLLTRPGPDLSTGERDDEDSPDPLDDWQKTAQARARVRDAIEQALDDGLPRAYTPEVFKTKAGVMFQHFYERYGRAA